MARRQVANASSSLLALPNVGPATVADLHLLGITEAEGLRGQDGYAMYATLCERTGQRHDPCVIDVFLSIVHFVETGEARKWWDFTAERKRHLAER